MITIGHSLGAAVLHKAVKTHIEREMLATGPERLSSVQFGDLVVYINPAFSAIDYDNIHQHRKRYQGQGTLLLTLAANGDFATGWAYRASLRSLVGRGVYHGAQRKRAMTTLGNYAPYYTHRIVKRKATAPESAADGDGVADEVEAPPAPLGVRDQEAEQSRSQREVVEQQALSFDEAQPAEAPQNARLFQGNVELRPAGDGIVAPECEPFVVIFDDARVVMPSKKDTHNDIFNPSMRLFLLEYLALLSRTDRCPTTPRR